VGNSQGLNLVHHELDAPPWRRFESTLMATSKMIRRAYDSRLEHIGLNLSEACLLALVAEHGPITQSQVAVRIGMGRAPAGTIIDTLNARGLLERHADKSDRRVWLGRASNAGVKLAQQISDVDSVLRLELREGLTREDRQGLADTLMRLQANIDGVVRRDAASAPEIS
jgi:DNA-binding MarR family transcriptional regulator